MIIGTDDIMVESASRFQVRIDGVLILFAASEHTMTLPDWTWFRKEIDDVDGTTHLVELFVKGIKVT